ncbi:DUF2934 domain-containing protein [Vreelandella sp. EE22]
MTDNERVRQLAYSIWEAEGRPEGQQQQHWERALKIAAAENVTDSEIEDDLAAPRDESPMLEDELPLEEDEMGIDENRLPLDNPEDAALDEIDSPGQALTDEGLSGVETDGVDTLDEGMSGEDATDGDIAEDEVPVQDRGHSPQEPAPAIPAKRATKPGGRGKATAEKAPKAAKPAKKTAPRKKATKSDK